MTASVISLPELIRIRATGADRVRFLHNFCTHDINGLQINRMCEAFFVNVKARVLAHGYVLAGEDFHEIWMLPGDESQLMNHLTRYVITEHVEFESLTDSTSAMAIVGTAPLPESAGGPFHPGEWAAMSPSEGELCNMDVMWNGTALRFISGPNDAVDALRGQLADEGQAGGIAEFERLRIL
jgi:folate-binding Fe-S cluster repair protein YgfZ